MYEIQKNLVNNYEWKGKKWGKGFYDYLKGGKKKLWLGLKELYNLNVEMLDKEIVGKCILYC